MTEVKEYNKDDQSLRSLVYHTDARVTAMEGQLASLGSGQLRQEQKIDQLIATISRPKDVNWSGWAAFGLAVMIGLFAANNAITKDTELRMEPMRDNISLNYMNAEGLDKRLRLIEKDAAEALAIQKLVIDSMKERGDDVDILNSRMAASETDRQNIHKILEDMDKFGSRKWIPAVSEEG